MAVPGLTGALMAIAPSSAPTTSSSSAASITTSTSSSTTITTSTSTGSSSMTTSSSISTSTPIITTPNVPFNVLPLTARDRDLSTNPDTITGLLERDESEARARSKSYRTTLTALTSTKMASLMPDAQVQGLASGQETSPSISRSGSGSGRGRLAMLLDNINPKGKGRNARGGGGADVRGAGAGAGVDVSLEGGSVGEVTVDCLGEPLADAFLVEPIPYRSAVEDGATHVIVLRTRPDPCRCVINTTHPIDTSY